MTITDEDLVSLMSKSNKCTQSHSYTFCLSVSAPCCLSLNSPALHIHPLRAPVLHDCGRLTVSEPLVFIRLSWREARLCETSLAPGFPAVLMALGRRHEQEDLCDLLSAAVTRCPQPASYQAQQPDKPLVPCCTPLGSRRVLKPATSNNSRTNLGIGDSE